VSEAPGPVRWGEPVGEAPAKKRGIPAWLWIGGCSCLALVALAVLALGWLFAAGRRFVDPAAQWADVAEVLPYDGPPPKEFIFGFPRMRGVKSWTMVAEASQVALIHVEEGRASEIRARAFDPEQTLRLTGRIDPSQPVAASTVLVQGRELRCLRYVAAAADPGETEEQGERGFKFRVRRAGDTREDDGAVKAFVQLEGPTIRVDLTREGARDLLILEVASLQGGAPVSEETVRKILAPFHVGPDRVSPK
jgi:hypothetical protein